MKIDDHNFKFDGSTYKIAIVLPYFNESLGLELLENTIAELKNHKVSDIEIVRVAGTLEIPYACQKTIQDRNPDAIIALGIIIRGETSHYELVTETSHQGLMNIQLKHNTPIIFGLLGCENLKQAKARVSKDGLNKGKDAAQAALIQLQI